MEVMTMVQEVMVTLSAHLHLVSDLDQRYKRSQELMVQGIAKRVLYLT